MKRNWIEKLYENRISLLFFFFWYHRFYRMKWLMDVCNRYLIFLFFCVTWKSNEKTWGVCLCFWVVCSLNHRGAKSEELNWIYSRCEQELLCLSILSFVTSRQSSAQHDAVCLNRFVRSAIGIRQFTYTHARGCDVNVYSYTEAQCAQTMYGRLFHTNSIAWACGIHSFHIRDVSWWLSSVANTSMTVCTPWHR